MNRRSQTILALDPGLRDLGYAVLAGSDLITSGVLPLRFLPKNHRLGHARKAIRFWIRGYRPRTLVLEGIPRRPLDAIGGLPALGRALSRLARRHRLKVASYSARTVRKSVVGNGWAGKRQAAEVLSKRYPQLRVHLTHDRKWKESYWQNMFDAVALGLHHEDTPKPISLSRYFNKPPSRSR